MEQSTTLRNMQGGANNVGRYVLGYSNPNSLRGLVASQKFLLVYNMYL